MNKEAIRRTILARRNALSAQEIRRKSNEIAQSLFHREEFLNAKEVCVYLSFGSEVRTEEIIEQCSLLEKKVVVPAMVNELGDLEPAEFLGFDKLKKTFFGIQEPFPVKKVPIEEISLVIAPGVAFDMQKNRIGFGKGYYDRFLARLAHNVPIIALAFELQIVEPIEPTQNDIKMTKIITEKRLIS